MRLLISQAGTVALSVSADDVSPVRGVMARDLTEFIAQTYQFAVRPIIPPNVPPAAITPHIYQSGVLLDGSDKIPILQFMMIPNGDVATAGTTDAADKIIDDVMAKLDAEFGYRFATAKKRRHYHSALIVAFDHPIEERYRAIGVMEQILNSAIPRPASPFKLKRLAFGSGDPQPVFVPSTIEAFEQADFVMERRQSVSYSENRYFCSAPLRTAELEALLHQIEATVDR